MLHIKSSSTALIIIAFTATRTYLTLRHLTIASYRPNRPRIFRNRAGTVATHRHSPCTVLTGQPIFTLETIGLSSFTPYTSVSTQFAFLCLSSSICKKSPRLLTAKLLLLLFQTQMMFATNEFSSPTGQFRRFLFSEFSVCFGCLDHPILVSNVYIGAWEEQGLSTAYLTCHGFEIFASNGLCENV